MDRTLAFMPYLPQRLSLIIPHKESCSKFLLYQCHHSRDEIETRMAAVQAAKMAQQPHPMLHRLTALDFSNQTVSSSSSLAQEQVRYRCVTLLEMSPLSQLVQLSLKDVYLAPVNMILERCLRLRELSIGFTVMGAVTWDEDQYRGGSLPEPPSSVAIKERSGREVREGRDGGGEFCSSQFPLRSLVLQNVETSFHSLIQWLGHLPSLHTLRLQSMRLAGTDTMYTVLDTIHPQFYAHIGAACPSLRSLHISFDNVRRQQPQTLDHLQACFSCLQELSLGSTDLPQTWANMLPQLFDWLHVSSLLTSFEITPSKHGPSRGGQHVELLHLYLCSEGARRLRHLRVKGIYFPSEYLTQSPPRGQPTMQPAAVWKCRQLETLHIRFENVRNGEETAREARQMFGYLSRVCPELRDLWIAQWLLYLGFNSGMCLLTRLQKLERLTIVSYWGNFLRLRTKDLEWIGPWYADQMRLEGMEDAVRSLPGAVTVRPAKTHTLRRLTDLFRRTPSSSTTSPPPLNGPHPTPNEYLTWRDLNQLGQIQDLINWNDERHQLVQSSESITSTKPPVAYYRCWPYMSNLEFAMATWSTRDEFKLLENLKLMRPDIQFKAASIQ
ncbi:hypothetical protein BGZ74_001008 [Mortierella antarctica]|nr:hypothetical protein BGZ74_001008 [Mortierella antarctica]